jgi:hypothetical protein
MTDVAHRPTVRCERGLFGLRMFNPDGVVQVDGLVFGTAIGVHIGVTHHVDVTHLSSGLRIASFDTLGAAVEFAVRALHIVEWGKQPFCITSVEQAAIEEIRQYAVTSAVRPRHVLEMETS